MTFPNILVFPLCIGTKKYHISISSFFANFVQGKASPNFILFVSLEKGGDLCDATGVILEELLDSINSALFLG